MRKNILWVDDEIEFLRSHIDFLESRGYDVTKADSGALAVRLISERPNAYDIVLLDLQMPVKSGSATLETIKAIAPNLPVIALTGYEHSANAAFANMADGTLAKPVDSNMILQECKRIIDSRRTTSGEFAAGYARAHTENLSRLNRQPSASGFLGLCRNIALLDIEIKDSVSEGIRQQQAGLKYDVSKAFCSYVVENYPNWIRGSAGRPMLTTDIVEKTVIPELNAGRGVFLIALSGLRLDQFLVLEPELKKHFSVSRAMLLSLLPTAPEYGMPSLVSGLFPDELYKLEPELYKRKNGFRDPEIMARAMTRGLAKISGDSKRGGALSDKNTGAARTDAGIAGIKTYFVDAGGDGAARRVRAVLDTAKNAPAYIVVYLDVMELVINVCQAGDPNAIPPEAPAIDDATLRTRVRSKILSSGIFEMMTAARSKSCAVILTSDHGHILSDRPAVLYETPKIDAGLRHAFAREAAADERAVFIVDDPSHIRLPPRPQLPKCLMARENNYFSLAKKYGEAENADNTAFRRGGVSPEEMIMPVYICRHK